MDYKKIILYVATALVGVSLYNAWMKDYHSGTTVSHSQKITQQSSAQPTSSDDSFAPSTYAPNQQQPQKQLNTHISRAATGKTINVKTDLFDLKLSLLGGNVVSNQLLKYPVAINKPNDFVHIQKSQPR